MSLQYMRFYPGDYLRDTAHLSAVEHGIYLLLIMHYWTHNGLPDADDKLARIAKISRKEWLNHRLTIAEFFYEGWRHKRIDDELEKARKKHEHAVNAGHSGGAASVRSKHEAKQMLEQMVEQTLGDSLSKPEAIHNHNHNHKEEEGSPLRGSSAREPAPATSSAKRAKRAKHQLPEGWVPPPEVLSWAAGEGFRAEVVARELEKFRDYYKQSGKAWSDWPATFRGWMRRMKEGTYGVREDKSASAAARRLAAAAERGEFTFGPRPSLLPQEGGSVVQLLPKGRSEQPGDLLGGSGGAPAGLPKAGGGSGD